jgi:hypothetical protein
LHGGVLDLGVVEGHQLHHRRVELVLVAHRGGAALEVADVRALLGHDERALELTSVGGVDAEIRRQLHGTADAFRHEDERPVGEDRGVEGGKEVVRVRHHAAQVLLHEVRMVLHCLGERAEDDTRLLELLLERGGDGDAVEDRVHRHARELGPLVQGHPQLVVGLEQLRVHLVEALRGVLVRLRRRVV